MDGEYCSLNVKSSGIHGMGCYAADVIPTGIAIAEYKGEAIEYEEALRREDPCCANHSIYVFEMSAGRYIDAAVDGNSSRYINHSCEPNCRISREDGRPVVVSLRNIQPGEELTYDYDHAPEFRMKCMCGSKLCRGQI
jgi:hypothetical protein